MKKIIIIAVVIVIIAILAVWYGASQSGAPVPQANNQVNQIPAQTASVQSNTSVDTGLTTAPSDTSNAALQADLNSVDTQMTGLNSDSASVDSSLTATP